jgi:hypothetical protein
MNENRLLLCRPQGGLNDILCQIESCCRYADRFDRVVVVETDYHCTRSFKDDFSKYFVSLEQRLVLSAAGYRDRLEVPDVVPAFIAGKIGTYVASFERSAGRVLDHETRRPITFDFNKDYSERLLVHHGTSFQGGDISLGALGRLRLQYHLVEQLGQRLAAVGRPYSAVHVRHSDYQTHYGEWLAQYGAKLEGPVFVATDNSDVLAHFRSVLGVERVYSFSAFPEAPGVPLHRFDDGKDAYRRNSDAILDLLTLALAKDLYIFELAPNAIGAKYSGFSALAVNLKRSGPIIGRLTAAAPGR